MHVCTYIVAKGKYWMFSFHGSPSHSLGHSLSLSLELADFARLAGQLEGLRDQLALPPQHRGNGCVLPLLPSNGCWGLT